MQAQMQMTMAELIKSRRTIRQFAPTPVSAASITKLLNVAVWAPTHGNRQPWRFILFTEGGRRAFAEAVVECFRTEEQKRHIPAKLNYYENVPAHLIVVMPEDPRHKEREEDLSAASCLIQNFQLAAWEQGIGVVWKSNTFMSEPQFRERVGVKPGEKIVGVLHIGYPLRVPQRQERIPAERLLTLIDRDARADADVAKE